MGLFLRECHPHANRSPRKTQGTTAGTTLSAGRVGAPSVRKSCNGSQTSRAACVLNKLSGTMSRRLWCMCDVGKTLDIAAM